MIRLGFEHEVIKEEESNLDVVTKTEHEQAVERDGDLRFAPFPADCVQTFNDDI
jgi:hypothetical protein